MRSRRPGALSAAARRADSARGRRSCTGAPGSAPDAGRPRRRDRRRRNIGRWHRRRRHGLPRRRRHRSRRHQRLLARRLELPPEVDDDRLEAADRRARPAAACPPPRADPARRPPRTAGRSRRPAPPSSRSRSSVSRRERSGVLPGVDAREACRHRSPSACRQRRDRDRRAPESPRPAARRSRASRAGSPTAAPAARARASRAAAWCSRLSAHHGRARRRLRATAARAPGTILAALGSASPTSRPAGATVSIATQANLRSVRIRSPPVAESGSAGRR